MELIIYVHLKNRKKFIHLNWKNIFKLFVSLESVVGKSNLTREDRRDPLWRILFIDEKNLFSLGKISSDDISHVVDLRNWCLNILNNIINIKYFYSKYFFMFIELELMRKET